MNNFFLLLLFIGCLPAFSCKTAGSGNTATAAAEQAYPSLDGTTWTVRVKWAEDADTALFRPRFDAGGTGVQVDSAGTPTKVTFTWKQEKQQVNWTYPSTVQFSGTVSADGRSMTGTAAYKSNQAVWMAARLYLPR